MVAGGSFRLVRAEPRMREFHQDVLRVEGVLERTAVASEGP
jgi:hypothetical protein